MKFIPKYITTDVLAEYGEHLTHEAYNEMVKLNSTQGDYNTMILNQLFNTDEGIQIPYLQNTINEIKADQERLDNDMDDIVAEMLRIKGSLSKYTTFCDVRRMITESTQGFVKVNKLKAGDNIDIVVDALNNVTISATSDVTKQYVDEHDASTLQSAKNYTDAQIAEIPIPVVPTNISAFVNDVGYITDYTETDPIFGASPAASIESTDITNWNSKQEELVSGTNIKTINNISLLGSGNIDIQGGGGVETDPVFTASPAFGITNQDITDWNNKLSVETDPIFSASAAAGIQATDITAWNNKSDFSGNYNDLTNKPTIPVVPTNVSAFTNDAGYLTSESDPVFTASDAYGITSTDIINWNGKLDSETDPVFTASVAYGITSNDITTWNNKSDFSGDYNDLLNKPTIPTVPTNVSAFTNDAGYITGYTETDPVFSASVAAGITAADITRWNNSGGGGTLVEGDVAETWSSSRNYYINDLCYYNGQIWEAQTNGTTSAPGTYPEEWSVYPVGSTGIFTRAVDHAETYTLNYLNRKLQYTDVVYDPGAGSQLATGTFLFLYV